MNIYRTHNCNELKLEDIGKEVTLSGFVKTVRSLGGCAFIDLRDHYGITQVMSTNEEIAKIMDKINVESTITVVGTVVKRPNSFDKLATGDIEIDVKEIKILNSSENILPFEIEKSHTIREDLRLEYRYLDLRNEAIHKKIIFRSQVLKTLRDKMDSMGFIEIQTPILTSSSPEGARDFLIPSRLHPGEFYALPQAPQQFKQLLMISGFDKYYQIAPCFRDEDPRADRSPGEFYQLDFEMAFATQEEVLQVLEEVAVSTFTKLTTSKVSKAPFEQIPYRKAMDIYGSDKPDLRNPLILKDAAKVFADSNFNVFKNKTIKAITVDTTEFTRKFYDEMVDFAKTSLEMNGLAWVKLNDDNTLVGTICKFISDEMKEELIANYGLKPGFGIFFIANEDYERCVKDAGAVRIELGKRLKLINEDEYKFCFVVDFPFFEKTDEGEIDFAHNPFSMPQGGLDALNNMDPFEILAYQYDMVCNGYEVASGAVRNHEPAVMVKAFEMAGYTKKDVENKFGALFNAFKYGAPPHAGAAPGIDRLVMLLCKENNIREVIAFPKNSKARDLLMQAPNTVFDKQLKDIHIKLDIPEKK